MGIQNKSSHKWNRILFIISNSKLGIWLYSQPIIDLNSQSNFYDVLTRPYKYLSNTLPKLSTRTICTQYNPHVSFTISTLNSIHVLETKNTIIPIESNIRLKNFKPFQIIGWCNDIDSFMNWNIYVLESITDIQYPCSDFIHSHYINVDPEQIIICY